MKVVIFGAKGQLGRDLTKILSQKGGVEVFAFGKDQVDITDKKRVSEILNEIRPSFIFNAAAWNDVDGAENPANSEKVFQLNAFAPFHISLVANKIGSKFINVSTDYVFDGEKRSPYEENDEPNPLSIYALSKLLGELLVKTFCQRYIIIRSGGLYGIGGSPMFGRTRGNFPEKVLDALKSGNQMKVVYDVFSAPTYTQDLARKMIEITFEGFEGLVHIMQNGIISWFEFARLIAKHSGFSDRLIQPVSRRELETIAKRPMFSVLRNSILEKCGKNDMMEIEPALCKYLKERGII